VVANKYLEPALVVSVDDKMLGLAREGRLRVRASLCFTLTDEAIGRTVDNKQAILQGQLVSIVGQDGRVSFNKLKIMEVSSKHQHQAFSIQLQLEEWRTDPFLSMEQKLRNVGNPAKCSPLHVQSRITKRKRSNHSSYKKDSESNPAKKRLRGEYDSSYVDITSLLVLPQKEAATRLGISESMLCKRFKECTRRKWPYRYLRKIDKMLDMLTVNKKVDSLPQEDLEKIEQLKSEREECLLPVKIRITGHDAGTYLSNSNGDNSPVGESSSESDESFVGHKKEEDSSLSIEDDVIAQVVSTLNLLKQAVSV